MKYLQFKYNSNKELYKVFHKLLELRNCEIYISENLYLEFLQYISSLPLKHYLNIEFIHTGILMFSKSYKIIIQSDRVRDGIFYVGRNNTNGHI